MHSNMKVLMLTLLLVVLSAVTALPPNRPPGRGSPGRGRGAPGGPAPPPAHAPSPAGVPPPGTSPLLMSPPAPPRQSNLPVGAPSPPGRPSGAPTSGRVPHGIPLPPSPPGQVPPQGPRDGGPRDRRIPIMPPGHHRGSAPGNQPRPADTPDPTDQPSADAMPENCTKNGDMVRSPVSCNTYYVCVHGKNIMMPCPAPLQFDPSSNQCNWESKVGCEISTTTTTTTTEAPASTRPPIVEPEAFDEDCKDGVLIRIRKLDNGNFLVFQCSPGFGYFPLNVDCDPSSDSCKVPIQPTPKGSLPLRPNTVRRLMNTGP